MKTFASLGKIRVGRVTENTHIFWPKDVKDVNAFLEFTWYYCRFI